MAAEGGRLRKSLETATRVQKLINDYNHVNNKVWDLDKLLFDSKNEFVTWLETRVF